MRLQILVVTLIIKYPEIPRRGNCAASCGQTGQTWRVNSKIPVNLLQGHPNVHATLPTHYLYYLRVFKFTMTNMANRPSQAYTASALKMEAVFFPKVLLPSSTLLVALTQQTKIWTSLLKKVRHFGNIKILCHMNSRKIRNDFFRVWNLHMFTYLCKSIATVISLCFWRQGRSLLHTWSLHYWCWVFVYTLCVQRNVRLTEIQTSQPKHAISHYCGINAQACFRRHFAVFHNERLPDFI